MNYEGIIIGIGAFLIIGLLHPVVIKAEYYFSTKIWPIFLVLGTACVAISLLSNLSVLSDLMAVAGFSFYWSIKELFEQEKRVQKGWFPMKPKKVDHVDIDVIK